MSWYQKMVSLYFVHRHPYSHQKKKKNFVLYQFNVPRNTDLIISTPHLRDQVSHEVQGRSAAFMTKQDPAQGKELYGI